MDIPGLELKTHMSLMADLDLPLWVPVRLYYQSTDPYAVHCSFYVTPDHVVQWMFARDLLDQGLTEPTGTGDVKITPIDQSRRFSIELESPAGYARLEGPAASVRAWLAKTFEVVPAGRETERIDIDSFLAEVLSH
ncbi:SsgA family sporulation/cell division regulator [Streptomyces sp. CBMA156]|uniref:SsgA family sporulation/cell division regulator n=1 Tax=Streptomyces sp. CBMA156 TaxID=1930280 RepID=UPI0016619D5A|nr:SsgA family sporulation/cell division regulator [Streptomyces sp. CBMA156]MBD0673933.1 SsgG protein [Streptomyces sp. CBMA156]